MVVGVVVFVNNAHDITTSVSPEDRLDNRGGFYRQKSSLSSFKGRHRQLVNNVELYFTQMFVSRGIFFRVEVPFNYSKQLY